MPLMTSEIFPVSPQQERIWKLQHTSDSKVYQSRCSILIEGGLDPSALERAWETLMERYQILRTTVLLPPGLERPVQTVNGADSHWLDLTDLGHVSPAEQQVLVDELFEELGRQSFEFSAGPTARLRLVRLANDRHVLIISLPAHLSDGTGLGILMSDLAAVYGALQTGAGWNEEPFQYAVVAEWLREAFESAEGEAGRKLWRKIDLSGLPTMRLPGELRAEGDGASSLGHVGVELSPKQVDRLVALANGCGVDSRQVLLAAWSLLLNRLTGQPQVIVGVGVDGRTDESLRRAVGPFARYLPVVLRPETEGFVPAFIRSVAAAVAEAEEWQECFDWNLVRHNGRAEGTPLLPFLFDWQAPVSEVRVDGVSFSMRSRFDCLDHFLVRLTGRAQERGGLAVDLLFDGRRLPKGEAERLAERLEALLDSMAGAPEAELEELEMLGPAERRWLLEDCNATAADLGPDRCFNEIFEHQVGRTPGAPAVSYEGEGATYAEVEARANQLAHSLRRLGVGPEVLVGICLERSLDMVVALLATLKAGGAYLPLDLDYPVDRLTFMLRDAKPLVLVTRSGLRDELWQSVPSVVDLALETDPLASESTEALAPRAIPENLAYVIYTSGSTGRPKGVMVSHRGLVNYLAWCVRSYGVAEGRGTLVHSPLGFDLTITSLLAPLAAGGCATLLAEGQGIESLSVALTAGSDGLSLLKITPTHLEALADLLSPIASGRARALVIGGEALRYESVAFWRRHAPATCLINEYGPTEAVVGCCIHEVLEGEPSHGPVPIGRPIANVQIHVLDPRGRLVPAGVPGELHVGGVGLARAYLARPELSAERFIPHFAATEPGARLYRTGDLVRRRPNGTLEFLGRIDDQVKVRGYRVELGEIESCLCLLREVRESLVVIRGDGQGGNRLVAYVTPRREGRTESGGGGQEPAGDHKVALDSKGLRDFLATRLPEYMVPSAFMVLSEFPRTPNGKIDKAALPEPERARSSEVPYVAPRTQLEHSLHGIWKEVLGLEEIGVQDNFFELGGHSLLASRLVAQIRAHLELEVPLRVVFASPTISALASEMEIQAAQSSTIPAPPAMKRVPRGGPLPLSFGQERLWFLYEMAPESDYYNISLAHRLSGPLHVTALEQSFNKIAQRHEVLRTRFGMVAARPVQIIDPILYIPLPIIDLGFLESGRHQAEVERLAREQESLAFDLESGPIIRTCLVRLGEETHVLVGVIHHIAFDGWSAIILFRELVALYNSFVTGETADLPEIHFQYADFACWQREWLEGAAMETLLAYWREQLVGVPVLDLPTDRPRPSLFSGRAVSRSGMLPVRLARGLHNLSQREGGTLYMTLLAALLALMYRYSGQTDIVSGTPIANRNTAEIHDMIGFFANTITLRGDLSANPGFRDLLVQIRDRALGAYAHQYLPFERLVEELQPERDLSRNPLFQLLFTLDNSPRALGVLHGLQRENVLLRPISTQVDVSLATVERLDGSISATFTLRTDLFDGATAERMLGHFETLLQTVAGDSRVPLDDLPLLRDFERDQILSEWSGAGVPPLAATHSALDLFAARVDEDPARVALLAGGERWTYGELDRRSWPLARQLSALGVGPEVVIALCIERSPTFVVGMLAVLRAGGAYLPLDAEYPEERLQLMLEDSGAQAVLVTSALADRFYQHPVPLILVDVLLDEQEEQPSPTVMPAVAPEQAAYLVYTSGSTGRPKGVAIPHRGIANLAICQSRGFDVRPGDRVLQFCSLGFDASVSEIWMTLASGAGLILAQADELAPGPGLVNLLSDRGVTHLTVPPSSLALLPETAAQQLSTLRTIVVASEPCPPELARRWSPGRRFINAYGPSEATVCTTMAETAGEETVRLPIGRPLPGIRIYVVDRAGAPVPVGIPGELYVGGVSLARGYRGLPAQSAERLVPDPFSGEPGARLYRTGDLVRFRSDGNLEFFGRIDHQVKVRGFRIELGEVEAVLARHPAVREVVVTARGELDKSSLVAYVVANSPAPSPEDLRGFLESRVPEHLVPSQFILVEQLPVLPNGKVDRAALAKLDPGHRASDGMGAPRSSLQLQLLQIWEEVIDARPIRITDSFFDLGGHSLLGVSVVWRIQECFGVELPPHALFQSPTIEQLAQAILESGQMQFSPLVPMQIEGGERPFFCVHSIGGNVMRFYDLARRMAPDRPFYGIQAINPAEAEVFPTLKEMAAEYVEAIRAVQPGGPYHLGGYSYGSAVAFEMARQLEASGEKVGLLGLIDGLAPLPEIDYRKLDDVGLLLGFARDIVRMAGAELRLPTGDFQDMDLDTSVELVSDKLLEAGILTEGMDPSRIRRFLYGIRGRIGALRNYRPELYSGKITLFRSSEEEADTLKYLEERGVKDDSTHGWQLYTTQPVDVRLVPGYHATIVNEPAVAALAEQLRECIAAAEAAIG